MTNLKPLDPLAKLLHRLLEGESAPLSALSALTHKRLQAAFDAGALQIQRSGAGKTVVCVNQAILRSFATNLYPNGLLVEDAVLTGTRTGALTHFRDTKAMGGLDFELAHVRVFDDAAFTCDGHDADAARQTQQRGCISVVLGGEYEPQLAGSIALVEGPELFMRYDWVAEKVAAVVLYSGRISERMLAWLGRCPAITAVRHCADYDPVGLCEYLRVRERLAEKLVPHAPPVVDALFRQYSKPGLLQDNAALMPRLCRSNDPYVRRIVGLMQTYGAGLEHEALLAAPAAV
ncbi:hypothetical protein ACFQ3P_25935 [Paraburkholderia sabiae]|uniref:Uncharacterized protein n=1 Tax=Paraburkholderia sabiae TaxID=273251 RepID=A0ABU9QL59_9BURK|nr:hypothetical protein [Paraburkholderia sabiae]WJZ77351.1 hypothetical protein QEN71_35365 [Paraburkholderia sabiae]CAD6547702.1 hypothetical protein LMG24235_04467 [Paraburkholderia sabiae]